ncbi:MAG TPA: FAD-dependent oxidoreductase, partial [Pirellulaceae bacterium]
MTLALRLAQQGRAVTLFEAADHLGGLADSWELHGVTWDRHYHVTLLSDVYLRKLLNELELEPHLRWVETKTGFYIDQQLHSLSNSWEFLRFPPLSLIHKLRLGWTIFLASRIRDWKRLESEPVESWLRRHSGDVTFERIWLPLLRAKLGDNYRRTSAAFIWATISRMYAARRTGLKKEMFGYVSGGYRTTHDRLEQQLRHCGVRIACGTPISHVDAAGTSFDVHTPGGIETFDRVVLTMPGGVIARACPQLSPEERDRLLGIEYQGILCASLLLRRPLSPYYVTNVADARIPFTGVIE